MNNINLNIEFTVAGARKEGKKKVVRRFMEYLKIIRLRSVGILMEILVIRHLLAAATRFSDFSSSADVS